uniref:Immunoglobulin subtype domain-containing protein n=1 Tax=Anguilla anguilla TaxID=7936 RepID=A0A0E9XX17_ANGAN
MSDMRLTSLKTKMKIILCTFLLCITAVSVFGQSVELNGIVGESIEFPTKVETSGSLIHSSVTIGLVQGGELISLTHPEFKGRVQWNKSTGLFSLSGLRLEDSGVYTVEKDDGQKSVSTFSLTAWSKYDCLCENIMLLIFLSGLLNRADVCLHM